MILYVNYISTKIVVKKDEKQVQRHIIKFLGIAESVKLELKFKFRQFDFRATLYVCVSHFVMFDSL